MGYDIARFQNKVDEEFICPICLGVLEEPVMVPRCEHSFCKNCINEWLDQQRSCPVDRQSVTSSELKPVPRILKNFLSHLLITCDFADLGCSVVVKLELLETHEKECEHNPNRPVLCKYGCRAVIAKDECQHFRIKKLRDRLRSQKQRIHEMREDISLLRAHAEDWIRVMQLAHPMISTINRLSAEGKKLRWVHSLERGCVANWGALIATPDLVTQSKVQRALRESSCPSCLTIKLVGNAHVSR